MVSGGLQHAASIVACEAVAPTKEGANQSPLEGAKISKARTLRSLSLSRPLGKQLARLHRRMLHVQRAAVASGTSQ